MKTWLKENGFEISKVTDTFGHYFRIDPSNDKVAQMIKWHYDDSTDCYFVKWQMWTGIENKRRSKMYPTPKRNDNVEWECETYNDRIVSRTDNDRLDNIDDTFYEVMKHIKEHSEEKFELMRDYMKNKGHKV